MEMPHVFVLIGDCLRAANSTTQTLPFLSNLSTVEFTRCYTPGTWTRPSHASLYSQQTPVEHGITRRGDTLSSSHAVLPEHATRAGYLTALFSENPTFSRKTGFQHGIEFVDDAIHRKPFASTFSPDAYVDDFSVASAVALLREVARRPNRIANAANLVYGAASATSRPDPSLYPHHGERVFSHLRSFGQQNATRPLFCLVNLLDTHNPHHAPPDVGAENLGLTVSPAERRALAVANDDRLYLLDGADVPAETREFFESWSEVFERREQIYDAQIRYLDYLIEQWMTGLRRNVFEESLIVVTGDHGQLFGEEGCLGHQTSLHPHGVHVPLYVSPPGSWEVPLQIDVPVTWVGLSKALSGVVNGTVTTSGEFVDVTVEGSRTDGRIVVCADGPTWDVTALRESYDDTAVDSVCVRKIGFVETDHMTIYESRWGESTIRRRTYVLDGDTRELSDEVTDVQPPEKYATWLRNGGERELTAETSARLRQLGYR